MFILLIGLIGTVTYYYRVYWSEEIATTYFNISAQGLTCTDDSFIRVTYIPNKEDRIEFYFVFEDVGSDGIRQFNIYYDGRMKEIEPRFKYRTSVGVKENDYLDPRSNALYYLVDIQGEKQPRFAKTFLCNLFQDKQGEVRLNLRIQASGDFPITFDGLDSFNLEYVFPRPDRQMPDWIGYMNGGESSWDIKYESIVIKGNNPYIRRKLREIQFGFGVAITILTSSLVALSVDIIKKTKTED